MNEEGKIDLTNKDNLAKWCTELKCEEKDLVHAVLSIGNNVKVVNDFLILNRKKKE